MTSSSGLVFKSTKEQRIREWLLNYFLLPLIHSKLLPSNYLPTPLWRETKIQVPQQTGKWLRVLDILSVHREGERVNLAILLTFHLQPPSPFF